MRNERGGDAGDLGLVFGAGGLGALLISLTIGQIGLPRRHITFMYAIWAVACLQIAAYAVVGAPWVAMVVSFAGEACWVAGLLVWITLMQRVVPPELLGRVKSLDWLISTGLVPVSFAVVGPLAGLFGVRPVMLVAGLAASALTVAFYFLPGMRATELPGNPRRVILSELPDEQPVELERTGLAEARPPAM